jgi:hypothetical protein
MRPRQPPNCSKTSLTAATWLCCCRAHCIVWLAQLSGRLRMAAQAAQVAGTQAPAPGWLTVPARMRRGG